MSPIAKYKTVEEKLEYDTSVMCDDVYHYNYVYIIIENCFMVISGMDLLKSFEFNQVGLNAHFENELVESSHFSYVQRIGNLINS